MVTRYAFIGCNEKFIEIVTRSFSGWVVGDPKGEDIYMEPLSDCKTVGESLLKALSKSRDLSKTEEEKLMDISSKDWRDLKPDRWLFTAVACAERYKEWVKTVMKTYKYKTKKALMQNMQHISVEDDGKLMTFSSAHHLTIDGWGDPDGKTPSIEMKIPSDSSVEVIGAAVRYAIGNCRGLGADFMRNMLFPEGQPATFEKYLENLGLDASTQRHSLAQP